MSSNTDEDRCISVDMKQEHAIRLAKRHLKGVPEKSKKNLHHVL